MTTQSQIDANRENSRLSTGPITEAGKSSSARNSQTHGLFTAEPHFEPDEQDIFIEFNEAMYRQLSPAGLLEDALANEIAGATWRLRQCAIAEADILGFDEIADKTRRSIERARAAANCALHRSLTRLEKLQTERVIREQIQLGDLRHVPLADSRKLTDAHHRFDRTVQQAAKTGEANSERLLNELMNSPLPMPDMPDMPDPEPEDAGQASDLVAGSSPAPPELASFCKTDAAKAPKDLLAAFEAECCGNEGPEELQNAA